MRLTRFSDIGLRVLIYLERAGERPHPVTVAEIGKQFDIPLNHLVKVVGQLAKLGWVQATRGRNGGLRLAADPVTLTIGQVLRKLEGEEDELVDCEGTDCALKMDCQLRGMLRFQSCFRGLQAGMPPAQLALACGYYDQAHFNREFRHYAGMSPGAWKRAGAPLNRFFLDAGSRAWLCNGARGAP